MKNIILKSSSPRRKEILKRLGYDFQIKVYNVDETMDDNLTPYENVKLMGLKKASSHQEEDYGSILIGCDTIVVLDNKIYGKPKDREDCFNMLKSLSGRYHEVLSGVGVIYKDKIYNFVESSKVYFKELSDKDINDYIDTKEPFDKAGGYAIQGIGNKLVLKYEGSFDNIVGLPSERLKKVLDEINGIKD
ncbi:MAG: Maf family protein [Acholeplasmatales bacterium]|nr:Maf family protein [Acholeplasmatales bacterium]